MVVIITGGLAFLFLCFSFSHNKKEKTKIISMVFTFIFSILFIIFIVSGFTSNVTYVYESEFPIYSLKNSTQISGKGTRHSYIIDQKDIVKYWATKKDGRGMYDLEMKYVIIKEGDYVPHIEIYKKKSINKNNFLNFFLQILSFPDNSEDKYEYKIYVPKDSIIYEYELDSD